MATGVARSGARARFGFRRPYAALTNVFGRMVDDQRQGWALFAVMGLLFLAGTAVLYRSEATGNRRGRESGVLASRYQQTTR